MRWMIKALSCGEEKENSNPILDMLWSNYYHDDMLWVHE